MATPYGRRKRPRGSIDQLPSGAFRVRVYAGTDPITRRRHDLVENVPEGPDAALRAEKALTRLLNELDERRNPRTTATVNNLLDRYFALLDRERTTTSTYVTYADKHIRPVLGGLKVGAVDGEVLDAFYAELRRCRDHCTGRKRTVDHRTPRTHDCDVRCRPHRCRGLSASTVRQIQSSSAAPSSAPSAGTGSRPTRWRRLSRRRRLPRIRSRRLQRRRRRSSMRPGPTRSSARSCG